MAIEERTVYVTSDGVTFQEKTEAEKHEYECVFRLWCEEHICRGGEWSARMVAEEILEHWELRKKV